MGSHLNDDVFYKFFDTSINKTDFELLRLKKGEVDNLKIRFFYAPEVGKIWPKIFILTEKGKFYSEYLFYSRKSVISLKFNFQTFKPEDYIFKYGKTNQHLIEISKEEALKVYLKEQKNWLRELV